MRNKILSHPNLPLSLREGIATKKAFTLVELIVVITILAILATIWFVWYSQYLVWTRDSNRISQLKSISEALTIYSTKKSLPIPEDNVEIKVWAWASEKTIAYQGYAWKNIIEQINYSTEWVDPKDWEYFTYYLTKDRKYFQLMAFLEDSDDLQNKTAWIFPQVYAWTYEDRYPTVYWKKLWVLTDEENTPIQEVSAIKTAWELNISSTTDTYIARMKDSIDVIEWTGSTLAQINSKASCKRIYESEWKRDDWTYTIDPEGNWTGFKVYCDMTTDWGGWTKIMHANYSNYFSSSNWNNINITNPKNLTLYSILNKITNFKNWNKYTLRLQIWRSWDTNKYIKDLSKYTIWEQEHNPFTEKTDGNDYKFIDWEESTTCWWFSWLHFYSNTSLSRSWDPDSTDSTSCVRMQIAWYSSRNGHMYLDWYGWNNHFHKWQILWIR